MRRIGFLTIVTGMCVAVLLGGCGKQATKLALKFNTGDVGTYKVVTESVKDYKFEQPSINQTKEQQTLNRTEMTFNQKIVSVEPTGDAKALITIEEVKYLSKTPTGTAADFDSTREADKKNAMTNLIGQTYVIKITPAGDVAAVEDAQKARAAVMGDSMDQKISQSLLSDEMIKQRHAAMTLPEKSGSMAVGKTWNKLKAGPAGMLQPKSYEQIYTLKEVKGEKGQKVAVIDMTARPSGTKAPGMSAEETKGMGFFSKMFDNKETYTGKMMLDVSTGKVDSYKEKLKSEWVAVEPAEEQKSDKGPDVLTMGFTFIYDIEKVK